MSDFLDRPVFPFRIERSRALAAELGFADRAREAGFSGESTDPQQTHVARAAEHQFMLEGEGELQAFEDFLAALGGRQRGFWLASDERDLVITQGVSATVFRIEGQGLAAALAEWPGACLLFRLPDGTTQIGRIESAEADGAEDVVTLAAAPASAPAATWTAELLRYVRLTADAELGYYADRVARGTIRTVELPLEYAEPSAAPAARPAHLYEFQVRLGWLAWAYRVTSNPAALVVDGNTWHPAPITHGAVSASTEGDRDTAQLLLDAWAGNPFEDWLPRNIGPAVEVRIFEVPLDGEGAPAGDRRTLFVGAAKECEREGSRLTVALVSLFALAKKRIPAMLIGPRCNYALFDPFTCRLESEDWKLSGTIAALAADKSYADFECAALDGEPADYLLPGGRFETGARPMREVRTIRKTETIMSTRRRLWFNWPLYRAAVDDAGDAWPGCDHSITQCQARFDNKANFGGHPFVPDQNPSLAAAQTPPTGSKK